MEPRAAPSAPAFGRRPRLICPRCELTLRNRRSGRRRCDACGFEFDLYVTAAAAEALLKPALPLSVEPAAKDAPACVAHPSNASAAACSRCGDFICPVCLIRVEGDDLCARCFEHRVDRAELKSLQRKFLLPNYALITGIIAPFSGIVCLYFLPFALGAVAIGLGVMALLKIREKPALKGRGKAVAGIVLGSITIILFAAAVIAVIVFLSEAASKP